MDKPLTKQKEPVMPNDTVYAPVVTKNAPPNDDPMPLPPKWDGKDKTHPQWIKDDMIFKEWLGEWQERQKRKAIHATYRNGSVADIIEQKTEVMKKEINMPTPSDPSSGPTGQSSSKNGDPMFLAREADASADNFNNLAHVLNNSLATPGCRVVNPLGNEEDEPYHIGDTNEGTGKTGL
jgi:hypothetical protein